MGALTSVYPRPRAVGIALAFIVAACGAGGPGPTGPSDTSAVTDTTATSGNQPAVFVLYDNIPQPSQLSVAVGAPVQWRNAGANNHTVTNYSQGYEEWVDALVRPGESFAHVFDEPGEYGFICILHQEVGYISVTP